MSQRWLLVLGTDAGSEAPLAEALAALAGLGAVQPLAPARRSKDDGGAERWFTNRLVRLDSALGRDVLRQRLRDIEHGIGRSARRDDVPIDIDLLAGGTDGVGWQLDPHAREKGEHLRPHVAALLREAGLTLA